MAKSSHQPQLSSCWTGRGFSTYFHDARSRVLTIKKPDVQMALDWEIALAF